LARRPTLCLVDELAHSNAPGSRHPKRYQDVEDLLRAGVHVITTVNIQHMESLYDHVERTIGVKVTERLPDSVLGEADQIVNIDISAEDLLERLKAGKVYPPDRAERALSNFFTAANLTRLREIALAEMAHLIDRRGRRAAADQAPASATERVMVGLSSRSPNADALLRKTSRIADRFNAPWYAVYIQTPAEDVKRTDAATHRILYKNLELAKQLGGTPMEFKGQDVATTIAAFAREYDIKLIIMGKSNQPWHTRLVRGSILDQLLRVSQGVDVMIVDL
jgi:two-component system sensor histidine kinase KdpD